MKMFKLTMLSVVVLAIIGCKVDKVSQNELEVNIKIAKENARTSAKAFISSSPELAGGVFTPNIDSTQSRSCPQGDGWITQTVKLLEQNSSVDIICSTTSEATGCMYKKVFQQKQNLASVPETCNYDIDYPIEKFNQ